MIKRKNNKILYKKSHKVRRLRWVKVAGESVPGLSSLLLSCITLSSHITIWSESISLSLFFLSLSSIDDHSFPLVSSVGRNHLCFSAIDTIYIYVYARQYVLLYDVYFDYLVSFEVPCLICDRGGCLWSGEKDSSRWWWWIGWEYGGTTFVAELGREQGLERGFRGGRNHVHSPCLRRLTGTYVRPIYHRLRCCYTKFETADL